MNERRIVWIAAFAIALLAPPMAGGASLTWDTNAGTAGAQDGSGTWDNLTASNWWNGAADVPWNNANQDTAVFGTGVSVTAPYTVTVDAGGVTAGGMTFNCGGDQTTKKYYFKGGPITFAAASGTPTISYPSTASNTYPEIWSNISVAGDVDVANTGSKSSYVYLGDGDATTNSWSGVMRLATNYTKAYTIGVQFQNGEALGGSMEIVGMGGLISFLGNETYSLPAGKSITIRGYGGGTLVPHNARGALMGGNSFSIDTSPVLNADVILADNSAICSANTTAAGAFTIQGDISETGGSRKLTVTGVTTLILTGNCTYSGGTDVLKGTLEVDGTLGAAGSTVTVGSGSSATVLKGTGAVTGSVVVNSNSSLQPGTGVGSMAINGNADVNGGLNIECNSDLDTIDCLNVSGDLDLGAATLTFTDLGSGTLASGVYVLATYGGTLTEPTVAPTVPEGFILDYAYHGNSIALVPEPATVLLIVVGALTLTVLRRRP